MELPEDLVLRYEWPEESTDYLPVFRAPAEVLDRQLVGRAVAPRGGEMGNERTVFFLPVGDKCLIQIFIHFLSRECARGCHVSPFHHR